MSLTCVIIIIIIIVIIIGKTNKLRKRQQNNTRRTVDASKGDMLNETRKLLEEFYKPHNEQMYRLTRDKTFLYDKY